MRILKDLFLKNRKQLIQKSLLQQLFVMSFGEMEKPNIFTISDEYEDSRRECEKFDGDRYYTIPEKADFSAKA
ncbi:hypothetical protein MEC_00555 [Bartonella alsatica IBS 382]|uniref:Uncharacterized protein n=1 Tax=Bartonella alsatica IBS 382 TaxID=1094551 RepID=J0PXZ8_9HYPH|nr:hypothetical protein MEC_00555 [Bartonella alsatica IBS 382]